MTLTLDGGAVRWLPWHRNTFLRARAEGKPILLSVVAPWSRACVEMDRVSYADGTTATIINERVIAVRVDADYRPDIADRYDLGGLPTTAFLTPDGRILGGGTFVPAERLRAAVEKVVASASWLDAALPPEDGRHGEASDEALVDMVFSTFDEEHAGFGGAPKFPLTAPVRLAIDLHAETGDASMRQCAANTLDAMGWGPLYDEGGGGFFRCATEEDWSEPQPEKLLTTNAALVDLYVYAAGQLGQERFLARAADVIQYINRALAAPNRAWRVSEHAEVARQFSDGNAITASAMLRAAAALGDDQLGKRAIEALERVLLASYKPGQGVAHSAAGVRGLLADQVAMAAANLDAWEATGNVVYRMMAEELAHYALRTMWDAEHGGLFDRAAEALPDEPVGSTLKPFVLNCEAAVVLNRIAEATNDAAFAERARQTLDAMSGRAAESGPLAAHYLIARRALGR